MKRERLSSSEALGWSLVGFGAGIVGGLWAAGRLGRVTRGRLADEVRAVRTPDGASAVALADSVRQALQADPALAPHGLRAVAVTRGTVELTGWVPDRRTRPTPSASRRRWTGWPTSSTASWCRARTMSARRPNSRSKAVPHDARARPAIPTRRHRTGAVPVVDRAGPVHAPTGRPPLRDHDAAAQRDGAAAHGPRSQQHAAGRRHPVRADARPTSALAAGHRPRRHRHAERRGAACSPRKGRPASTSAAKPS